MKKLLVVTFAVCFSLSASGLLFAQTPSSTALEKASDNASFHRGDDKPSPKPNAEKMKEGKEKAVKGKADAEKAEKEKVEKETGVKEKAPSEKGGKQKVKAAKGKAGAAVEDAAKP